MDTPNQLETYKMLADRQCQLVALERDSDLPYRIPRRPLSSSSAVKRMHTGTGNVGVAPGNDVFILVLDGDEALTHFRDEYGEIKTFKVSTPTGMHVYLRASSPDMIESGGTSLGDGIRITNRMVPGPGSIVKGFRYEIPDDSDPEIALCPIEIESKCRKADPSGHSITAPTTPTTPPNGVPNLPRSLATIEGRKALDDTQDASRPDGSERRASSGKRADIMDMLGDDRDLSKYLGEHDLSIRYNIRSMKAEVKIDGKWTAITDRTMEYIKAEIDAIEWENRIWRSLWERTLYFNEIDPFLVEYLEALPEWDGTPRIDSWCSTAFQIDQDPDNTAFARWTGIHVFLGTVKRTLSPGYPLDVTPVLIGDQGVGKSKHLAALFPPSQRDAFSDQLNLSGNSKIMLEAIQGKALIEIAEMHGLTRARLDKLKAFMSRTHDDGIRLAYRRNPEPSPRRCIFVGTCNDDGTGTLPNDPTGNRRWLPVVLNGRGEHFDTFAESRDQIWAEAFHRIREGEDPAFPESMVMAQRRATEDHRQADSIEELIIGFHEELRELNDKHGGSGLMLLEISYVLNLTRGRSVLTKQGEMRLARALTAQGWGKTRIMVGGKRACRWLPPPAG